MQAFFGTRSIPISLGYNCHVKVFIDRIGELENRAYLHQPFDWLGSPMWSICEAVESDFSGFMDKTAIAPRRRFEDKPSVLLTHSTYNFCFLHDFGKTPQMTDASWNTVSEKYVRRIERWNTTLAKNELLFIRLETDTANRIEYPEFRREGDEKHYVERFADFMKSKGISFKILFLTTTYPKGYDNERNICYVQFAKKRESDIIGADQIEQIVRANRAFIYSCMR